MSERTKKILFAVFFVLFTLGMGYLLYYMYSRSVQGPATEAPPAAVGETGTLPQAGAGTGQGPGGAVAPGELPAGGGAGGAGTAAGALPTGQTGTTLLRGAITQSVSAAPGTDQSARFYDPTDGRFYKLNADGSTTPLGEKQFFNVKSVEWGNQSDQSIINFPDGSNVYYDFATQKQVPLPSTWQDFNFSNNDSQIVAKSVGTAPENRFLVVAKPDGSEAKAVQALGENQDLVKSAWAPSGQIVAYAMTGEPQSGGRQEIYMVGQNKENYKSLIVDGQGFLPKWSPSGKNVLYSVWNESTSDKPILWVASGEAGTIGDSKRKINLNTWADKCAWITDLSLYCAVPKDLPDYAGLDRASYATLPDEVYFINLRSGLSTRISTPEQVHPMQNIVLSGDQKKLMFTDANDGKLYSYDLPGS